MMDHSRDVISISRHLSIHRRRLIYCIEAPRYTLGLLRLLDRELLHLWAIIYTRCAIFTPVEHCLKQFTRALDAADSELIRRYQLLYLEFFTLLFTLLVFAANAGYVADRRILLMR